MISQTRRVDYIFHFPLNTHTAPCLYIFFYEFVSDEFLYHSDYQANLHAKIHKEIT